MSTVEHVTFLGHGAMATVCSALLVRNGHRVAMWGAHPASVERLQRDRDNGRLLPGARVSDEVRLTADDADCFDGATLVVSAVPTQHMRAAWRRLAAVVPAGVAVVSVAKGIELETMLRPTQIVADVLGTAAPAVAALSGPNIAAEIARSLPATAVAASADEELARRVQAAFATANFRVYTNSDVVGVELAGATKNVIAVAAGVLDGMAAGNNAKAALVTRGLVEITRLGLAMGAAEATFAGLAGLGDLITTCFSPEGRNRRVGEQLGRGRSLPDVLAETSSVAEGVATTRALVQLARQLGVDMPITRAVHAVLFEGVHPTFALTELMTRDAKPER